MPRGRVPESGESRTEVFSVRFSPTEVKHMDEARGEADRSVFIREATNKASRTK
jgi:hypothetical protein